MPCSLCDDTGWMPSGTGAARQVVRCECWRQGLAMRLLDEARIPHRYRHCALDAFLTYGNASLERAVVLARRLADQFPVVDRGLFLLGPPGVGKTHLAVAALRRVVGEKGGRGVFYDTRELLRVIRKTYDPVSRSTEGAVLDPVVSADLLVLDDLGAEKTSEWVEETLNYIVNERYSRKRLTIFTSNYDISDDATDPDSLQARVGFRMYSRLHEMCEFLHLDGADYRELPPNGGAEDLQMLWKLRKRPAPGRSLPARSGAPARASLKDRDRGAAPDLRWGGGKAGR
jgi:DNA replication protein DnaC